MIKNYIARSMMVSFLEEGQLERLHKLEKTTGYVLPNWNIQQLFNLPMIREKYNLPVDNELMAQHNQRIENDLRNKGFFPKQMMLETDFDRGSSIFLPDLNHEGLSQYLIWIHELDNNVQRRSGEIIWDYAGPKSNRRGLLQAVESTFK